MRNYLIIIIRRVVLVLPALAVKPPLDLLADQFSVCVISSFCILGLMTAFAARFDRSFGGQFFSFLSKVIMANRANMIELIGATGVFVNQKSLCRFYLF